MSIKIFKSAFYTILEHIKKATIAGDLQKLAAKTAPLLIVKMSVV